MNLGKINTENKSRSCKNYYPMQKWQMSFFDIIRDYIHMTSIKIVQFSRPSILFPLVHLRPNFFHRHWTSNFKRTLPPPLTSSNDNQSIKRKHNSRGVVFITTTQLHSAKPELRFCAGSNPVCSVSEIRNGEDLWQWSRL